MSASATALLYIALFLATVIICKITLTNNYIIRVRDKVYSLTENSLYQFICITLSCMPLIYLLANRVNVGRDYERYELYYSTYVSWGAKNGLGIGLTFIYHIADKFGWGFEGFLWVSAIITTILAITLLKNLIPLQLMPIAVFFYLCIYWGPMNNIMGQAMAVSVLLGAFYMMTKRRLIPFIILVVIASFFHVSSFLLIPLYWIYAAFQKKHSKGVIIGILLGGLFLAAAPNLIKVLLNFIGLSKYNGYFSNRLNPTWIYLLIYRSPMYALEIFYFLRERQRNHDEIESGNQLVNLGIFMGVCEIASFIIGLSITWGGRFGYFFSIGHLFFAIGSIMEAKDKKEWLTLRSMYCAYFLFSFLMMAFYSRMDAINIYSRM